ncbi:MAG: hypothetical protein ACTSRK_17945, partial [Promethearchaeota archaeon]
GTSDLSNEIVVSVNFPVINYLGCETFKNELNGEVPTNWEEIGTNGDVLVIGEKFGHSKVLEFTYGYDGNELNARHAFQTPCPTENVQTVEFWFAASDINPTGGDAIAFRFHDPSELNDVWLGWTELSGGYWRSIISYDGELNHNVYDYDQDNLLQSDVWMHIRFEFDYILEEIRVYFGDMVTPAIEMQNFVDFGEIGSFDLYSSLGWSAGAWLDSFSWDWHPTYNPGDLLIEDSPPESPVLNSISSPDYDGEFDVTWNPSQGAESYLLFRDTVPISEIDSLEPIYSGSGTIYAENIDVKGGYYYRVLATNGTGPSDLSNEISVFVDLPDLPLTPVLDSIDSPDIDGNYTIYWSTSVLSNYYLLYRDLDPIDEIGSLEPIYNGSDDSYEEISLDEETYYYRVTAVNDTGESELSNEISVRVNFPDLPLTPTLNTVPTPDTDGTYNVSWGTSEYATTYELYRSTSPITEILGLAPIYSGPNGIFHESWDEDGVYYYRVLAINETGSSPLSNEIEVEVIISHFIDAPNLESVDSPDADGSYLLSWNEVDGATEYALYRTQSIITDISELVPIYTGTGVNFIEENVDEGVYYYFVVARNPNYNSSLSNVITVEVRYENGNNNGFNIPGFSEFIPVSLFSLGALTWVFFKKTKKFTPVA